MKVSVLLLLLLPLHSFAQFGRSYTGPTMQQNQQSRQYFNQMTNQRTLDFQQRHLHQTQYGRGGLPTQEARLKAQANQQKLEQEATETLARLTQQLQRQRQEHPAQNPQLAAAQQKADDKQLTLLAVKSYRDVFLPGQVSAALQAQQLSPNAEQKLSKLNENLLNDAWWSNQTGAQATEKAKAYSDTLASLTTGLLGFNLSAPPVKPASFSLNSLNDKLTKDVFDQSVATQLIREAALTERLLASEQLTRVVQEFTALITAVPANPASQGESKKLRKDVQKSLRAVNKELGRYNARIASSEQIYQVGKALRKSTSKYLARNSK